ncbi:MAG: hypothetical protein RLZZ507_3133 [Cyanobacteriota bacterium]|jgi:O-antigen ligase
MNMFGKGSSYSFHLALWVGLLGIFVGLAVGLLAGIRPLLLVIALVAVAVPIWFFAKFEQAVLGLLIIRSSLDVFSAQQIPAAFAIGLNALILMYLTYSLLVGRSIKIDAFWLFFAGWVAVQGMWVVLLPLGGLGIGASELPNAIREWVRMFSWVMVYLLVMQLKDTIHPENFIKTLFLSLIIPFSTAILQLTLPSSLLPSFLIYSSAPDEFVSPESLSRINGTFGHPNTFATFLLLFMGLTCWRLTQSKQRGLWLVLIGGLVFFIVSTKALIALAMTFIFIVVLITPRLTPLTILGGVILFVVIIGLYGSTEFGRERLASIAETPLLNPDMDISRSILLSQSDGNSFNWRLAQWTSLLQVWQESPILGYGLATTSVLSYFHNYAHNDYVRALVEGGIIGFITYIIFLLANFFRCFQLLLSSPKGSSHRNLCLSMIGVFAALTFGMITENIWSHTTLFFYWSTILAILGWDWQQQTEMEDVNNS